MKNLSAPSSKKLNNSVGILPKHLSEGKLEPIPEVGPTAI